MALIGTIRKNFWLVLIGLGLALASFVIQSMVSQGNGGPTTPSMGKINGSDVDYNEFQRTETVYYSGNSSDNFAKRKTIWDFYVEKNLVEAEAEDLGINVTHDELMELQFGDNLSPIVQQNWTNPQTRQVDRSQLNSFRTAIEGNEEMNPQFRAYWAEQEKHIIKQQKQDKLTNMVSKGLYTPTWLAESIYKEDNTTVDFEYVKIPFDNINEEVEVTDAAIKWYMLDNKARFDKKVETRLVDYVVFDVVATKADSQAIYAAVDSLKTKFIATDNDSTFALVNSGGYANYYFSEKELPAVAKEQVVTMNTGEVYGPYVDNGMYSLIKLIDKKVLPDTVKARHILRKADRNNPSELAAAQSFVDSLDNLLSRGVASFDSLAIKFSEDSGSGAKGGDLGEFGQGRMVQEFNDVCFITGTKGKRYSVTTDFGVHLIDIQDQKFTTNESKYKIATIVRAIVPSKDTQSEAYDMVADLVSENRNLEDLKANLGTKGSLVTSPALEENDYTLGTLGSGQTVREMIRWSFNNSTEVGDVSPDVYTFTDQVNYYDNKYVIATLRSIEQPGMQSVDAVRSTVETAVKNMLKAEKMISGLTVTSLTDLAAKYNTEVGTVNDANNKVGFIDGVGTEPEVVGVAMNTATQSLSKALIGNSGVFVVKPISKQTADAGGNLNLIKQNQDRSVKSQANLKLVQALKDGAKIEDQRKLFF